MSAGAAPVPELPRNLGDHVSVGAEYRAIYLAVEDERDLDRFGEPRTDVVARIHGPLIFLRLRF